MNEDYYVKVQLKEVLINGYCKGSMLALKHVIAYRLIEQGYVTEVSEDTPFVIYRKPDNGMYPTMWLYGNTVLAGFEGEDERSYKVTEGYHNAWKVTETPY